MLSEEYIGQLLYVQPKYGWGWVRRDSTGISLSHEQVQALGGFQVRVRFLFGRHGLISVVEQEGHPFHGYWLGGYPRYPRGRGLWDRGTWDLNIGPLAPNGREPFIPTGIPVWAGHGDVREDVAFRETGKD